MICMTGYPYFSSVNSVHKQSGENNMLPSFFGDSHKLLNEKTVFCATRTFLDEFRDIFIALAMFLWVAEGGKIEEY